MAGMLGLPYHTYLVISMSKWGAALSCSKASVLSSQVKSNQVNLSQAEQSKADRSRRDRQTDRQTVPPVIALSLADE